MKTSCKTAILLISLGCAIASTAQAAVFATNPTGSWVDGGIELSFGTQFTVGTSGVTIGALGYFDEGEDGLVAPHIVSIYNMASTLLGSVTVPAGTLADLHDGTRWKSLDTPLFLDPSETYMLAATMTASGDKASVSSPSQITIASGFTLGPGLTYNPTGGFPGTLLAPNQYAFGANMDIVSVPEPASLLSTACLIGSSVLLRRRSKTSI